LAVAGGTLKCWAADKVEKFELQSGGKKRIVIFIHQWGSSPGR
jgi:hypothetical protein